MLKKSLLILFVLIFSTSSFAQTEETITESVPQITDGITNVVTEMIKALGPIIVAIEENKTLPPATEEMAAKLKSAINSKYNQNVSISINDKMNEVELTGEYKENDTVLKYRVRRNLAEAILISDLILGKKINMPIGTTPDDEGLMMEDLYNDNVDTKKLKTNKIYDNTYIGISDSSQQNIVLYSTVGAYITLTIQAKGTKYQELTNDFMYHLNYKAIREAVDDDNKDIEDIKKDIDGRIKDPLYMQKILQQQGNGMQHE